MILFRWALGKLKRYWDKKRSLRRYRKAIDPDHEAQGANLLYIEEFLKKRRSR
jgi:hypothetical protein